MKVATFYYSCPEWTKNYLNVNVNYITVISLRGTSGGRDGPQSLSWEGALVPRPIRTAPDIIRKQIRTCLVKRNAPCIHCHTTKFNTSGVAKLLRKCFTCKILQRRRCSGTRTLQYLTTMHVHTYAPSPESQVQSYRSVTVVRIIGLMNLWRSGCLCKTMRFLPARRYTSAVLAIALCPSDPSVRPSQVVVVLSEMINRLDWLLAKIFYPTLSWEMSVIFWNNGAFLWNYVSNSGFRNISPPQHVVHRQWCQHSLTDDHRQFITLSVHLCVQHVARVYLRQLNLVECVSLGVFHIID